MSSLDVLQTFKDRLLSIYRHEPNVAKIDEILAGGFQDTIDVVDFILAHLSIDDAEGEQLDIVGGLIGIKRPPEEEQYLFWLSDEGEFVDPKYGFYDDTDPSNPIGGILAGEMGTPDYYNPGTMMSDTEFRKLIRQRASNFRKRMTLENLYLYLIAFGARCKLDGDEEYLMVIYPDRAEDLNQFFRWYVVNRGFAPAGIKVRVQDPLDNGGSI